MKNYFLHFLAAALLSATSSANQDELNALVANEFRSIVAQYQARGAQLKALGERNQETCDSVLKLLLAGIWYGNDYFSELEKCAPFNPSAKARLEFFLKKDLFASSYVDKDRGLKAYPKGVLAYLWDPQSKLTPSEAITNLGETGLILLDCATTIRLAWYRALLKTVGAKDFDAWIRKIEDGVVFSASFEIDIDELADHPKTKTIKPGYFFHIDNHVLYKHKEVNGEFAGFNVMAISVAENAETRYIGFGLESNEQEAPQGITEPMLNAVLVKAFNDGPFFNERVVSADLWKKINPQGRLAILFDELKDEKIKDLNDEEIFDRLAAKISKDLPRKVTSDDLKSLLQQKKRRGIFGPFFLSYEKVTKAFKVKK